MFYVWLKFPSGSLIRRSSLVTGVLEYQISSRNVRKCKLSNRALFGMYVSCVQHLGDFYCIVITFPSNFDCSLVGALNIVTIFVQFRAVFMPYYVVYMEWFEVQFERQKEQLNCKWLLLFLQVQFLSEINENLFIRMLL